MKIKLTAEHIKRGIPCSVHSCAVALAIDEETHPANLRVTAGAAYVGTALYYLPAEAQSFIKQFDDWKSSGLAPEPEPFEFELGEPQ